MALNKENELCQKISSEVKNKFLQIYNTLKERETQLLRQVETLVQNCTINNSYDKCFKQISVVFDNEVDVLLSISKFGRIDLNELSKDNSLNKMDHCQQTNEELHKNESKEVTNTSNEKIEIKSSESVPTFTENSERPFSNVILECVEKQDPRLCQHEKRQENFSCCSSSSEGSSIKKYCDTINQLGENVNNLVNTRRTANQPVQVQLWMDQIIREPEIEPQPNNVMEYSQIKP